MFSMNTSIRETNVFLDIASFGLAYVMVYFSTFTLKKVFKSNNIFRYLAYVNFGSRSCDFYNKFG